MALSSTRGNNMLLAAPWPMAAKLAAEMALTAINNGSNYGNQAES